MQSFIDKAFKKMPKLTDEQVTQLISLLKNQYDTLEAVLNSVTQGVMVCNNDLLLIQLNKAAERFLPMISDPIEKLVWTVIDDDDVSSFVHTSLCSQEPVYGKEFYLNASGITRIIAVSIFPLVKKHSVDGTLITIDDITEKRTRESRLRQAENLASLTTLAAGVAHEIKNPLGAMSIHVQLLQKALSSLTGETKPYMEKYLGVVNEEMERLNKIVVDFLFAVRPMNLEFRSVNIDSLLTEIADFMQVELDSAGITLQLSLDQSLPELDVDEPHIKQAFLNLLKNAMAATSKNGKISITTAHKNDTAVITIADTGCGIPADQLSKIFEPYFTTKSNGTGLGLTLTYKIIKEHNGEIAVFSQLGEGTTFTITLPVPQTEQHLLDNI